MYQVYEEQFLAAAREMKANGMELFLLSAEALRERQHGKATQQHAIRIDMLKKLRKLCDGDISLTQCSVDGLIKRDSDKEVSSTTVIKGKADQSVN